MRISRDELFLEQAQLASRRSTCARAARGCVLVSEEGHVLATGYNGVPSGLPHCSEGHPCEGAGAPSGARLDECLATHAEANALLQCSDVRRIATCYSTVSPCIQCTKLLLNTTCRRLTFRAEYHDWPRVGELWRSAGRSSVMVPLESREVGVIKIRTETSTGVRPPTVKPLLVGRGGLITGSLPCGHPASYINLDPQVDALGNDRPYPYCAGCWNS